MRYCAACAAVLVLLLCFSGVGRAHRVNIFAFADGDAIQVECYFSRNQKVRNGTLSFSDLETGAALFEGATDEQGMFRFRPEADFLKTGHGLNILLNAGEGHQSAWRMSPEALAALSPSGHSAMPVNDGRAAPAEQPPQPAADSRAMPVPFPAASKGAEELEALIGRVMDAKLTPIKQALARQESGEPGLKDLIGGLGWIIGLLGAAAYMKYRR